MTGDRPVLWAEFPRPAQRMPSSTAGFVAGGHRDRTSGGSMDVGSSEVLAVMMATAVIAVGVALVVWFPGGPHTPSRRSTVVILLSAVGVLAAGLLAGRPAAVSVLVGSVVLDRSVRQSGPDDAPTAGPVLFAVLAAMLLRRGIVVAGLAVQGATLGSRREPQRAWSGAPARQRRRHDRHEARPARSRDGVDDGDVPRPRPAAMGDPAGDPVGSDLAAPVRQFPPGPAAARVEQCASKLDSRSGDARSPPRSSGPSPRDRERVVVGVGNSPWWSLRRGTTTGLRACRRRRWRMLPGGRRSPGPVPTFENAAVSGYLGPILADVASTDTQVSQGIRRTWEPDAPSTLTVWMFGGSTLFGSDRRDEHTIPSEFAKAASRSRTEPARREPRRPRGRALDGGAPPERCSRHRRHHRPTSSSSTVDSTISRPSTSSTCKDHAPARERFVGSLDTGSVLPGRPQGRRKPPVRRVRRCLRIDPSVRRSPSGRSPTTPSTNTGRQWKIPCRTSRTIPTGRGRVPAVTDRHVEPRSPVRAATAPVYRRMERRFRSRAARRRDRPIRGARFGWSGPSTGTTATRTNGAQAVVAETLLDQLWPRLRRLAGRRGDYVMLFLRHLARTLRDLVSPRVPHPTPRRAAARAHRRGDRSDRPVRRGGGPRDRVSIRLIRIPERQVR